MASRAVVDANVTSGVSDSRNDKGVAAILGAELPQTISTAGTVKTDDSVTSHGVIAGGTSATSVYYLRTAKADVTLSATSVVGTSLLSIDLDTNIDPEVKNLAKLYQKYRFKDLKLSLVCNSPFGTTSGSIILGHLPDPSNSLPSGTGKGDAALAAAVRLSGSRQLTPRNSGELEPKLSNDWKWCKAAGVPRLERFGKLFVLVRQACGKDSVAQWNTTLSATIEFAESTINSTTTTTRSVHNADELDWSSAAITRLDGQYHYFIAVPLKTIVSEGIISFEALQLATYDLTDGDPETESYQTNVTQMDVINTSSGYHAVVLTDILDKTLLDNDKIALNGSMSISRPAASFNFFQEVNQPSIVPSTFHTLTVDNSLPISAYVPTPSRKRNITAHKNSHPHAQTDNVLF